MDSFRDSIPIAIGRLRGALAEFVDNVRSGGRIRITRHGKPVAWIIGRAEHAMLERLQKNRRTRVSPKMT
jgi:prevent-host-death family protein